MEFVTLGDRVQMSHCSLYRISLFLPSLREIAGPVSMVRYLFDMLSSPPPPKLDISFVEYLPEALKIKSDLMGLFHDIAAKGLDSLAITIYDVKLLDVLFNLTNGEFGFDIHTGLDELRSLKLTFYSECAKLPDASLVSFIRSVMSIY